MLGPMHYIFESAHFRAQNRDYTFVENALGRGGVAAIKIGSGAFAAILPWLGRRACKICVIPLSQRHFWNPCRRGMPVLVDFVVVMGVFDRVSRHLLGRGASAAMHPTTRTPPASGLFAGQNLEAIEAVLAGHQAEEKRDGLARLAS